MPELYGAALKKWQAEGEQLSSQFGAASALGLMFALVLLICAGIYMKLTKFSKAGDF